MSHRKRRLTLRKAFAVAVLLAGCAQMPAGPTSERFETAPGKAVIYLVRPAPDMNGLHATLTLDDTMSVTTFSGTYVRWEVEPGTHRIAGLASDNSAITLQIEAGRLYFVQQTLLPGASSAHSTLVLVNEQYGRDAVARSQRLH